MVLLFDAWQQWVVVIEESRRRGAQDGGGGELRVHFHVTDFGRLTVVAGLC
jgi:hypothetical protein